MPYLRLADQGHGAAAPAGAGEPRADGPRLLPQAHQRIQLRAGALVQIPENEQHTSKPEKQAVGALDIVKQLPSHIGTLIMSDHPEYTRAQW
jgi:hypothetical protein